MNKSAGLSYEIQYTKAADKFLKTHEDVREQYEDAIKQLLVGEHPEKVDVKRIRGKRNDYYRIKLGGYRVVYAIINGKIIVISTLLAGVRGDVYKKMNGLK
jgi:mRNA interferase RelE/StbE